MPRAPKRCGKLGCTGYGRPYCPIHTAEQQKRISSTRRGYDQNHKNVRKAWTPKVATGAVNCWRCGRPITAGQTWHLGHDDRDRNIHRGPEHARCNTQAAARSKAQDPGDIPPREA